TTGRELGIESDARYRFERGLDPLSAEWGAEVAARLVLEFCGGEASRVVSAGSMPDWRREIELRPSRLANLRAVHLPASEQARILRGLGFDVKEAGDVLTANVPSWRADVEGEADLVEEVLRVHGFDRIQAVSLPRMGAMPDTATTPGQRRAVHA